MNYPMEENNFQAAHFTLLESSYQKFFHKSLLLENNGNRSFAQTLFEAPFAVVSHGTEADPVFNYANLKALELFGVDWQEFTKMPSRLSAEPVNREERQRLLQQVTEHGYIDDYQGVRISKQGQCFLISHAVVWNLMDKNNIYRGQAACFRDYKFLSDYM